MGSIRQLAGGCSREFCKDWTRPRQNQTTTGSSPMPLSFVFCAKGGRTPWSARDALVPLSRRRIRRLPLRSGRPGVGRGRGTLVRSRPPFPMVRVSSTTEKRHEGVPRRPGGLPHRLCGIPVRRIYAALGTRAVAWGFRCGREIDMSQFSVAHSAPCGRGPVLAHCVSEP